MFSTITNDLAKSFPPLYECSKCGCAVKVTPDPIGGEPAKAWSCEHKGATIWANRKVVLLGKGGIDFPMHRRAQLKITLTLRQLLSWLTGRSV